MADEEVVAPAAEAGSSDGKLVLLVDDDLMLSEMYAERMKVAGYNVLVAHDGEEGLAQAKRSKPHLILLDIMMPKMNGLDVATELKKDPEMAETPIIFLTALIQELDKVKGISSGASDYYVKSETTPGDLIKRVDAVLKGTKEE